MAKKNQKKTKKVKKQKKPVNKLMVIESPVAPGQKLTIASELADDRMIEDEMMGQALPYFIYQFQQEGKTVSGLSVKGVNEVVRRLGRDPKSGSKIHIKAEHQRVERDVEYDGEKGVEVWVFAEDLVSGNSAWGTKFEPYWKTGRNGKYKNTFALEKALSKAERNAKRKLIAETLVVKMIEKMLKEPGTVKQISGPSFQTETAQAPDLKKSTPEELEQKLRDWVAREKKTDQLIKASEMLKGNKAYRPEFVKEIQAEISRKVDALENK